MILYKIGILSMLIIACICGCNDEYPCEVEEALTLAKGNRSELIKVLNNYQKAQDSLKYKAACFLISNMKWHSSSCIIEGFDRKIPIIWDRCDSLYTKMVGKIKDEYLDSQGVATQMYYFSSVIRDLLKMSSIDTNVILKQKKAEDLRYVSSSFLISHIDNAFDVWRKNEFAKHLTFENFCEYILPYRSIVGKDFFDCGKFLNDKFSKHINRSTEKNLRSYLFRYNHYTNKMWFTLAPCKINHSVGIYDLFFTNAVDCETLSSNECNVLRACGFPVVVEYMVGYRAYRNRHYFCSFNDSLGMWHRFNAQSYGVDTINPIRVPSLNLYRNTFAAQKNSPYFLKGKGEFVPQELYHPCIKDITQEIYETGIISLPFSIDTSNKLAYLFAFNGGSYNGLIPVTWGEIDRSKSQVTFQNVILNVLYFPMYMKDREPEAFSDPFYLTKDSLTKSYRINYLTSVDSVPSFGTLFLKRKFPCKQDLQQAAIKMVNGKLWGANSEDFSDSTLLLTIERAPEPFLQEYALSSHQKYRYFRYDAPGIHEMSSIAELELLEYQDSIRVDSLRATPLPLFTEEDVLSYRQDNYINAICAYMSNPRFHAFSDKNNLSFTYSTRVYIDLTKPVKIEKVRLLPRNADNIISPGDEYKLMYWENGWKLISRQKAKYNYLKFENVPLNKIYWLIDISKGQEDLPFIYKDGKQLFIYKDIISSEI